MAAELEIAPRNLEPYPLTLSKDFSDRTIQTWLSRLSTRVRDPGQISWEQLYTAEATITDIPNRDHDDLTNISGGDENDYQHWSAQQIDNELVRHWITIES